MTASKFLPDAYYRSLADIDFTEWKKRGYRLVLLDLDNTLIRHGGQKKTAFSQRQIARLRASGLKSAILSNAMVDRVIPFAKAHNIPFVAQAKKPSRRGVLQAAKQFGFRPHEILLIGDQIFTDVVCGRRAGAGTILVAPLSEKERWYIRLKRLFEEPIRRNLKRRPRLKRKKTQRTNLLFKLTREQTRSKRFKRGRIKRRKGDRALTFFQ